MSIVSSRKVFKCFKLLVYVSERDGKLNAEEGEAGETKVGCENDIEYEMMMGLMPKKRSYLQVNYHHTTIQ
jgi:hypothetical protein